MTNDPPTPTMYDYLVGTTTVTNGGTALSETDFNNYMIYGNGLSVTQTYNTSDTAYDVSNPRHSPSVATQDVKKLYQLYIKMAQ